MIIDISDCRKHPGLFLLLLTILLCTSCGSKLVRGEPPVVRITELGHRDNTISLQLNLRNLNGVDLDVQSIDFRLTAVESKEELVVHNGPVKTNIVANGVESWSVETPESEAALKLLNSLENGEIMSLPYRLKGSVSSVNDGNLRFEYEGHLYPLPGRPGRFR
jgi:hypothetical protein